MILYINKQFFNYIIVAKKAVVKLRTKNIFEYGI